jgi:hypothetical protein
MARALPRQGKWSLQQSIAREGIRRVCCFSFAFCMSELDQLEQQWNSSRRRAVCRDLWPCSRPSAPPRWRISLLRCRPQRQRCGAGASTWTDRVSVPPASAHSRQPHPFAHHRWRWPGGLSRRQRRTRSRQGVSGGRTRRGGAPWLPRLVLQSQVYLEVSRFWILRDCFCYERWCA